jgi:hypothetical protein
MLAALSCERGLQEFQDGAPTVHRHNSRRSVLRHISLTRWISRVLGDIFTYRPA